MDTIVIDNITKPKSLSKLSLFLVKTRKKEVRILQHPLIGQYTPRSLTMHDWEGKMFNKILRVGLLVSVLAIMATAGLGLVADVSASPGIGPTSGHNGD